MSIYLLPNSIINPPVHFSLFWSFCLFPSYVQIDGVGQVRRTLSLSGKCNYLWYELSTWGWEAITGGLCVCASRPVWLPGTWHLGKMVIKVVAITKILWHYNLLEISPCITSWCLSGLWLLQQGSTCTLCLEKLGEGHRWKCLFGYL